MRPFVAAIGGALLAALCAIAQAPAAFIESPSPCGAIGAGPCHPAVCSGLRNELCNADDSAQIGRTPRVRIAAPEENAKDKPVNDRRDEGQLVNTLQDMFAALHACWMPPAPEKARPGMEYTVRFAFKRNGELIAPARVTYSTHGVPDEVRNAYYEAVGAAFRRCTPMHFSTGMAGSIAGRPLWIHIFDDRIMIEHFKSGDPGPDKEDPRDAPPQDGQPK